MLLSLHLEITLFMSRVVVSLFCDDGVSIDMDFLFPVEIPVGCMSDSNDVSFGVLLNGFDLFIPADDLVCVSICF